MPPVRPQNPLKSTPPVYSPINWYWTVPTVNGFVFSSWRSIWVPMDDKTYLAWVDIGGVTKSVDSTPALASLLTAAGLTDAAAAAAAINQNDVAGWQANIKGKLAAYRYDTVSGGVTISISGLNITNLAIKTDPESRSNLSTVALFAMQSPSLTVPWKSADGTFVTLNAAQIIEVGEAVLAYVQQCFATEAGLVARINAASTYDQVMSIDITKGWPSNVISN